MFGSVAPASPLAATGGSRTGSAPRSARPGLHRVSIIPPDRTVVRRALADWRARLDIPERLFPLARRPMVLTALELLASLQDDVRILTHLIGKLDAKSLDYRPTTGQRSARELVVYLSMMGPALMTYALAETPDISTWVDAETDATGRTFDEAVRIISTHGEMYAALLAEVPDAHYRSEFIDFDGNRVSRGAFLTNLVLAGTTMYRMQLFLYLKACGLPLTSANLWMGQDAPSA